MKKSAHMHHHNKMKEHMQKAEKLHKEIKHHHSEAKKHMHQLGKIKLESGAVSAKPGRKKMKKEK